MRSGAQVICDTLLGLGATVVFGMPGSQNVALFDALRSSKLRTVATTHEMAAAFAAIGFYRASGNVGVVTTIPGPGFTFASTALIEAFHDSAALLHIVPAANDGTPRPFQFQDLDQPTIARAVAKDVLVVNRVEDLAPAIARGHGLALAGEPGPVVVLVDRHVFRASTPIAAPVLQVPVDRTPAIAESAERVAHELAAADRIALFVGQGGQGLGASVHALAERLNAAVLTTSSGRGVISEDDPRSLYFDLALGGGPAINHFLEECDLVLALGCKFSHNGSGARSLRIARDRLVRVDSSIRSLQGNYPARVSVEADLGALLGALSPTIEQRSQGWTHAQLAAWRSRVRTEQASMLAVGPPILTDPPTSCGRFFEALQLSLPGDSIVVTDSGLHQALTRGHLRVRSERGLIAPADFQSMGFGVPAAIGAKIAAPGRQVVLVIGDGGMAMSGLELLSAVRERLDLTVVVFNDGQLNFIRLQQIRSAGRTHMVGVQSPDFSLLAQSIGARYWRLEADMERSIRACLDSPGVNILEVPMADFPGVGRARILGTARRLKGGRRLPRLMRGGSPLSRW